MKVSGPLRSRVFLKLEAAQVATSSSFLSKYIFRYRNIVGKNMHFDTDVS